MLILLDEVASFHKFSKMPVEVCHILKCLTARILHVGVESAYILVDAGHEYHMMHHRFHPFHNGFCFPLIPAAGSWRILVSPSTLRNLIEWQIECSDSDYSHWFDLHSTS